MDIKGRPVLVVGGATGLGAATVRALAAEGANVTVADVNVEQGQALASELDATFVRCDVRDEVQVAAAVDAAAQRDGGLRAAVCCAGTGWAQKVASSKGPHPLESFRIIQEINLFGTFNVLRLAAAAMRDNEPDAGGERGVCVLTASGAAFEGQIGQVAYAASKAAIVGLTLPAARDLADRGIRVVSIAPGLFDTQLLAALGDEAKAALGATVPFPPRLGVPAEFAALVQAVVANPMLNGTTIRLDGGLRMAPR
ncbi:SDR family NAD(P)-dependent oxidoreductase [Mycobacterium sp. ML4]